MIYFLVINIILWIIIMLFDDFFIRIMFLICRFLEVLNFLVCEIWYSLIIIMSECDEILDIIEGNRLYLVG